MSKYLNEAFRAMGCLNEEVFSISDEEMAKLSDFLNTDFEDETEVIIDPEAEKEEDLKDSYVGKIILNCPVCNSMIYKDKEDIIFPEEDEESEYVNEQEDCPYCQTRGGFKIIGEVSDFHKCDDECCDDECEEEHEEVEEEEVKEEGLFTPDVNLQIHADNFGGTGNDVDVLSPGKLLGMDKVGDSVDEGLLGLPTPDLGGVIGGIGKIVDGLNIPGLSEEKEEDGKESIAKKIAKKVIAKHKAKGLKEDVDGYEDKVIVDIREDGFIGKLHEYRENGYKTLWAGDHKICLVKVKEEKEECLKESVEEVTVKTEEDGLKVDVKSEDGTVTIEKKDEEEVKEETEETIEPLSDETAEELVSDAEEEKEVEEESEEEDEEEKFAEVDFDEFDEESFNKLGESYLKNVYENVKSFKTTSASQIGDRLFVEGQISFDTGKEATTKFIFESQEMFNNEVRFSGKNCQISDADAFTLHGVINDKKLVCESLQYKYECEGQLVEGLVK